MWLWLKESCGGNKALTRVDHMRIFYKASLMEVVWGEQLFPRTGDDEIFLGSSDVLHLLGRKVPSGE